MLPKRLVRSSLRILAGILVLCTFVVVVDFYFNFLPASVASRIPLHINEAVLLDVEIKTCFRSSSCPEGKNGWYKHPKNLYLGQNWFLKGFLYTRRVQESELAGTEKVVLDVALPGTEDTHDNQIPLHVYQDILKNNLQLTAEGNGQVQDAALAAKLGWQLRQKEYGLWVKYGKYSHSNAVSQLKVLFSESAVCPLPGWIMVDGELQMSDPKPRLAMRRGKIGATHIKPLKFRDGKFKIVQIADLHMSTGNGVCDHPVGISQEECIADERTMEFVSAVLDTEQPDFVVFTGDQIMGDQAPDPETALLKALGPVIDREIPWAIVFGNHDEQSPWNNAKLMEYSMKLPGCMASPGNVTGVGNYVLTAKMNDHTALSMYFMDTHAHVSVKGKSQYDWIREDQLALMKAEYQRNKHDTEKYAHIPLSMAFFHIPLPEYRNANGDNSVGNFREAVMAPTYNSGALKALTELGVSVMTVGHDHCNDYCMYETSGASPAWLCYGGAAGEGGYGGYPIDGADTQRRIRVFEVDAASSSIYSWKWIRDVTASVVNKQTLVQAGQPVPPN